jgi:hypothetical protein
MNEYWFSLAWGILGEALQRHKWSVTDEEWIDVEQAIMRLMAMATECDPCGITIEVDVDGKITLVLSPTVSVSTDETFLSNPTYDSATSTWSFFVGEDSYTLPGVSKLYPDVEALPDYPDANPEDNICAASIGAIDYFVGIAVDACTKLIDDWQQFEKISDFALAILSVFPGGSLIATPLDNLKDFTVYLGVDVIEDARDALNNSANRDTAWETLYCLVRGNGDVLDLAIWGEWLDDVASIYDIDPPIIPDKFITTDLWRILGWELFRQRFSLHSHDLENDCRLLAWCEPGGCVEFDFAVSDQGFTSPIYQYGGLTMGQYASGYGWKTRYQVDEGTTPDQGYRWVIIDLEFPEPLVLTRMRFEIENFSAGEGTKFWRMQTVYQGTFTTRREETNIENGVHHIDLDPAVMADGIRYVIQVGRQTPDGPDDPGGEATISWAEYCI